MIKKWITILGIFSTTTFSAVAQEILAEVSVNHQRIQNVDKKIFQSLETGLQEFINTRKWTKDQFQNHEKIACKFNFNIMAVEDNTTFKATLNINAGRPVFGTNYESPTFTFRELQEDFVFKYDIGQPIVYDDNRISGNDALASNLTAVIAYYIYIILGLDYDSFSPLGGTEYFKKAQYIVQNAPTHSTISGWDNKGSQARRSRFTLIEQFLNPRFEKFRPAWYTYHRQGLDLMKDSMTVAQNNILSVIPELHQIHKENPNAYLLQVYFNSKSQELLNIMGQIPSANRKEYVEMLSVMDISNAAKYKSLK